MKWRRKMTPDARLLADSMVQADLWGHQSHGVLRAGWYLARLQSERSDSAKASRRDGERGGLKVIGKG